jgi:hypothetical protein
MARALTLASAALFALALGASASACDVITSVGPKSCNSNPEENPPVTYSDGTADGGIYMSSPWDRDLLYFPGGMVIRLEHKLGKAPRSWQAYLAFDEDGVQQGSVAQAAGNQVELVGLDDQAITVKNGSCADYWLLVTAEGEGVAAPSPPAGG